MKMKRLFAALAACALTLPVAAFAACGDGNPQGDVGGDGVYVFEAEGVDLSEQSGRGWSNEETGCGMIQGENKAVIRGNKTVLNSISNKYFVGFFSTAGTTLEFNINAESAVTGATLVLRLASEWGTLTMDDSVMTIEVNGTTISCGVPFKDFEVSSKIDLNQGENTIKLIASGKPYPQTPSLCMGPGVDCIKIKSDAKLTWDSLWEDNKLNLKVDK